MAKLDMIGSAYGVLKDAKRRKENEARERTAREMAALRDEFAALAYGARVEGASVSAIAREMGTSRPLVYAFVKRGGDLASHNPLIANPNAEFFTPDAESESGLYWVTRPGETKRYHSTAAGDIMYDFEPDSTIVPGTMPDDDWFIWWNETGKAMFKEFLA